MAGLLSLSSRTTKVVVGAPLLMPTLPSGLIVNLSVPFITFTTRS